jgi:coproporphyrinogen III oxidase-like Fe-S oxidoreductase
MASNKDGGDLVKKLKRRVMRDNDDVKSEGDAIAILKDQGMVKQDGDGLKLTDKGAKAARG